MHSRGLRRTARARGHVAVIAVFALILGAAPAWAGATTYDIGLLLYQPHPWIDQRPPDEAADTGPPMAAWRADGTAARRRVVDGGLQPGRFGSRGAGQPEAGGGGYQAAAHSAPDRQDLPGPYSFFVYGGMASSTSFTRNYHLETTNTQLYAAGMTARLYRFDFGLEIEGEVGLGRRFGQDELWEGWVAAGVRWRDLPWNHIVNTTFGLAFVGLDYTTKVPPHETKFHHNKKAQLLNFFSPEITLALPEHPEVALLLRIHHRSPVFGLVNEGAASFFAAGLRFQY